MLRRGSREDVQGGDQGGTESLFVLPAVFVMVLAVIQVGVWAHAQHRVQAIASQTLASARTIEGSTAAAHRRADIAQEQLGGAMLDQVEVDVTRGSDRAEVSVRARAVKVVPGVDLPVSAQISGPVEHFAP